MANFYGRFMVLASSDWFDRFQSSITTTKAQRILILSICIRDPSTWAEEDISTLEYVMERDSWVISEEKNFYRNDVSNEENKRNVCFLLLSFYMCCIKVNHRPNLSHKPHTNERTTRTRCFNEQKTFRVSPSVYRSIFVVEWNWNTRNPERRRAKEKRGRKDWREKKDGAAGGEKNEKERERKDMKKNENMMEDEWRRTVAAVPVTTR